MSNVYENAIIYRLVGINSSGQTLYYIGSTARGLEVRRKGHVTAFNSHKMGRPSAKFCYSFKVLECPTWVMEVVESCPCSSKTEMLLRENFFVKKYWEEYGRDRCVNHNLPIWLHGAKERYETNRKRLIEYSMRWQRENRARLAAVAAANAVPVVVPVVVPAVVPAVVPVAVPVAVPIAVPMAVPTAA